MLVCEQAATSRRALIALHPAEGPTRSTARHLLAHRVVGSGRRNLHFTRADNFEVQRSSVFAHELIANMSLPQSRLNDCECYGFWDEISANLEPERMNIDAESCQLGANYQRNLSVS